MKPGNVLRGLLMAVLFLVACEPLTADSAGAATTIPRLDPGDTNPIVEFDAGDLALQDGDVVSAWGGQSAVGHPTYLTVQTPNGRPAVAFNGAGDRMGDNIPLSASPAGDWVLVAVIKPKNTGVYHNLVDDDAQNRPMLWIDPGFNYELNYAGGSGAKGAGSGPGGWDIVIADSRLNQLYINSPVPNATGGDSIPLSAPESFDFFHRDGNQTYTGLVAELRIYNDRADFGGDFAALYNEMTAKWFLTNFHADPLGSLRNQTFDLTGANFNGATLSGADFTNTILNGTSFVSATLDAVDFSYAIIICADFSYTKLLTTRFGPYQEITPGDDCHTKFAHSAIDINAIDTEHWGNADFSYTRFQNVSPSTFSLQGKTISGAILAGVNLSSIDMSGADLTGVDFSNATLNNVNLDNAALNGATLTLAKLSYASARCARFHGSNADNPNNPNSVACPNTRTSDDPNLNADLTQATLIQTDLTNATLDNAILTGANLSGATLRNASFVNANLEPSGTLPAASVLGADLSGAIFSMAHVNNVQFNEVLLTGAIFDRSTLQGTNFTDSVMPNASFEQATLEAVNFHNAILQHANFAAATMKTTPGGGGSGVDFTCAQLGGANFADATVTAATFQSAVMPPASDCCRPAAGDPWCGYINATQQPYGPVTYPVLNANVTCPNGEIAPCSGDQWKIPSWRTNLCSPDRAMPRPPMLWSLRRIASSSRAFWPRCLANQAKSPMPPLPKSGR
ncbi:MAG: pentapeptide repeat-containing protein [Caldilineaceae bacterium]|nr:pentapeptide repeat-containing protein [Caldilineaceae bacterium]